MAGKSSGGRKRPRDEHKPLERAEEEQILEQIARTGSAIARIQALKLLHKLRDDLAGAGEGDEPDDDEFSDLDELEPRRRHRSR